MSSGSGKRLVRGALWGVAGGAFGVWGLTRRVGRREAPILSEAHSILVIRLDLMGDLVFTLPAIDALREAAPRARITALVLPYTADLIRGHPSIDRTITVDVNRWRRLAAWAKGSAWRELRVALAELRREPHDLAVSFYGRIGAAAAMMSGARYLVGYRSEGYPLTFDLAVQGRRYRQRRHEAEYCLDLVRALLAPPGDTRGVAAAGSRSPALPVPHGSHPGGRGQAARPTSLNRGTTHSAGDHPAIPAEGSTSRSPSLPVLRVDPAAAERVGTLLAEAGCVPDTPLVALHPGALNMEAKRWLPERWAIVADRVQQELGRRVVLVGSSSEMPLAERVRGKMRTPPLMLAGRTSVAELMSLLKRCDLFLGGDSGPLHVASALGVPSVSINGPTDPAITGPLGPHATVVRSRVECGPCYDLAERPECRRGDLRCMAGVAAEEVFEAVRVALGATGGRGDEATGGSGDPETGRCGDAGNGPYPRAQHSALSTQHSVLSTQHPSTITHPSSLITKILVIKLAGIGDLLTAFPALAALRRAYSGAQITALVTPQSAQLLQGQELVDRMIVLDKYLFDDVSGFLRPGSLVGAIRLGKALHRERFDATVLLHHLVTWPGVAKYALLMLSCGSPLRVGLDDGRGRFLSRSAPDLGFGVRHEVEYWLQVVGLLGATNSRPRVRLSWGAEEEALAEKTWHRLGLEAGRAVAALHPGTGSYSPVRRWGPERFAALARALAADGLETMVIAGPGEGGLARSVVELAGGRCVLLEGLLSLQQLAAVLARCRLFVGNDSGVTHLAAAAGLPVVAVFGPSNHRAWAPYDPSGERTRVVRLGLPCAPCLYRGHSLGLRHGCGDARCLLDLDPAAVIAAARDLLGHRPKKC